MVVGGGRSNQERGIKTPDHAKFLREDGELVSEEPQRPEACMGGRSTSSASSFTKSKSVA